MLGVLITTHRIDYILKQNEWLKGINEKHKVALVTTCQDVKAVDRVNKETFFPIYQVDQNPGHMDGVYIGLSTPFEGELFDECDYVLHFHGDVETPPDYIDLLYMDVKGKYKVGSQPRQWMFDRDCKFIDGKSVPFHTSFFIIETQLGKSIFKWERLDEYKNMSIQNGHPDCHFETMMYAALSEYNFDYDTDLYHTDSIMKLKEEYGNEPVYYNFTFPDSKTIHHDERGNIK